MPDAKSGARPLPLQLAPLDHYTLIVEDAAATAKFHTDVMGFEELGVMLVNAGSVPEGEHDMFNHVLQIPGTSKRVALRSGHSLRLVPILRRRLQLEPRSSRRRALRMQGDSLHSVQPGQLHVWHYSRSLVLAAAAVDQRHHHAGRLSAGPIVRLRQASLPLGRAGLPRLLVEPTRSASRAL